MTNSFTPGPWLPAKLEIPGHAFWVVLHAGGRLTEKGDEGEANARIQAAAPEMYEALKDLRAAFITAWGFEPDESSIHGQSLKRAAAAIAAVRGGE